MTITLFSTLLFAFSTITSLVTQAVKKFLDEEKKVYSSNILVLIIACFVGVLGTSIFYVFLNIQFNLQNILCILLLTLANWVGSMVGYDKVIQTIKQISSK